MSEKRDLKKDMEGILAQQSEWRTLPTYIIIEYIQRAIEAENLLADRTEANLMLLANNGDLVAQVAALRSCLSDVYLIIADRAAMLQVAGSEAERDKWAEAAKKVCKALEGVGM